MMRKYLFFGLMLLLICGLASAVQADIPNLGVNSTIYDNTPYDTTPPRGQGQGYEDNEVQAGAVQGQPWDLEAFFYKTTATQNILSMVGGWNFNSILTYGSSQYKSGDIFIDTDGNARYGNDISGNPTNNGYYGYNYGFKVNWTASTWELFLLRDDTPVTNATVFNVANPFTFDATGLTSMATGNFTQNPYDTGDFLGWLGVDGTGSNNAHYYVTGFDLSSLSAAELASFTAHFTYTCGNDVLIGNVPLPGTVFLLGAGLMGLGFLGRRRRKSNP